MGQFRRPDTCGWRAQEASTSISSKNVPLYSIFAAEQTIWVRVLRCLWAVSLHDADHHILTTASATEASLSMLKSADTRDAKEKLENAA